MANTNQKNFGPTKMVIPCRISFANIWEPKSINGSEEKYSVSCVIPKSDKALIARIEKAIEAAREDGKTRRWGGKIPPNLKLPLRDGDIDRPDDENYQDCITHDSLGDAIRQTDNAIFSQMGELESRLIMHDSRTNLLCWDDIIDDTYIDEHGWARTRSRPPGR